MTPLPPPCSSTTTAYTHLLSILHTPNTSPLEIDILPSSHSPNILYDPISASVGIPRPLLTPLFIHAHSIFFSHIHSTHILSHPSTHPPLQQPRHNPDDEEAYNATTILLLHDPTHTTALNFRKARLLTLQPRTTRFHAARQQEISFLTSLLTSPLVKHTKASTLWAHRLWVVRLVPAGVMRLRVGGEEGRVNGDRGLEGGGRDEGVGARGVEGYWERELEVVMKAGERHPRNYYAWGYARDLLRELAGEGLARGVVGRVHRWCLQHPRDVSGWAFLEFLLREVDGEGDGRTGGGEEATRVIWETKEFVRKYEWRGESIEWFLKSVQRLA